MTDHDKPTRRGFFARLAAALSGAALAPRLDWHRPRWFAGRLVGGAWPQFRRVTVGGQVMPAPFFARGIPAWPGGTEAWTAEGVGADQGTGPAPDPTATYVVTVGAEGLSAEACES